MLKPGYRLNGVTEAMTGDHLGGHLSHAPRLVDSRPDYGRRRPLLPGVEQAPCSPYPEPVGPYVSVKHVLGCGPAEGQEQSIVRFSSFEQIDTARNDGTRPPSCTLSFDALARSHSPDACHAASLSEWSATLSLNARRPHWAALRLAPEGVATMTLRLGHSVHWGRACSRLPSVGASAIVLRMPPHNSAELGTAEFRLTARHCRLQRPVFARSKPSTAPYIAQCPAAPAPRR